MLHRLHRSPRGRIARSPNGGGCHSFWRFYQQTLMHRRQRHANGRLQLWVRVEMMPWHPFVLTEAPNFSFFCNRSVVRRPCPV